LLLTLVGSAASTAVKSVDFVTKFKRNWKLYSTIPIVAGLLNWSVHRDKQNKTKTK
jgi:hypothetical protein